MTGSPGLAAYLSHAYQGLSRHSRLKYVDSYESTAGFLDTLPGGAYDGGVVGDVRRRRLFGGAPDAG